ncbi:protein-glutamate O-methyltransferase CheR [uncultured Pseudokineococcus sp.]|uniref:CheR family methyltransferase n=1 Tax=uncultured Pseudokineococcus sp. TaxID=1642928 RepID=UPI00262F6FFC|nr:CheR family methyltransferase [uncultured Pseudokineococcus sp.]
MSAPAAPSLSPADLAWVCEVVRAETAVVLDASKEYLVTSRLLPLARRAGLADVGSYVARARAGSAADRWELVEAMTTNETSWFRDVEPFTYLRERLLPELAAARPGRSLRVWSAACSTGQEPYTIAMLLADAPELRGFRTEVLATDVDRTALERARSATYSQMEVGRGLPADLVARHLERAGLQWRVREPVRSCVRFAELNLARPFTERGRFDVVFCRNVLIYFDTVTKQQVLDRIHQVLAPDGVLVLGAAETTLGVSSAWTRVEGSRAALYRPAGASSSAGSSPAGSSPTGSGAAGGGRLGAVPTSAPAPVSGPLLAARPPAPAPLRLPAPARPPAVPAAALRPGAVEPRRTPAGEVPLRPLAPRPAAAQAVPASPLAAGRVPATRSGAVAPPSRPGSVLPGSAFPNPAGSRLAGPDGSRPAPTQPVVPGSTRRLLAPPAGGRPPAPPPRAAPPHPPATAPRTDARPDARPHPTSARPRTAAPGGPRPDSGGTR